MSLVSQRVTFDALCVVWPPVSDRDRVAAFAAFEALPHEGRRDAYVTAPDYRDARHLAGLSHPLPLRLYLANRLWVGFT